MSQSRADTADRTPSLPCGDALAAVRTEPARLNAAHCRGARTSWRRSVPRARRLCRRPRPARRRCRPSAGHTARHAAHPRGRTGAPPGSRRRGARRPRADARAGRTLQAHPQQSHARSGPAARRGRRHDRPPAHPAAGPEPMNPAPSATLLVVNDDPSFNRVLVRAPARRGLSDDLPGGDRGAAGARLERGRSGGVPARLAPLKLPPWRHRPRRRPANFACGPARRRTPAARDAVVRNARPRREPQGDNRCNRAAELS